MLKKIIGPLILGVAGCAALISLCVWQIDRLAWKEGLIAKTLESMNAAPSMIADVDWTNLNQVTSGQPFEVTGKFLDGFADKLSGAGYNRIIPFQAGNHVIMVETGFVDQFSKSEAMNIPSEMMTIKGRAYFPEGQGSLDATKNIWVGYNLPEMAVQLNAEPFILVADESPIAGIKSSPFTIDLPNNHLQYAITWGLLALAWAAMTVYWGYSRMRKRKTG